MSKNKNVYIKKKSEINAFFMPKSRAFPYKSVNCIGKFEAQKKLKTISQCTNRQHTKTFSN